MAARASTFVITAALLVGVATFGVLVSHPAASPRGEVPVVFADITRHKNPVFLRGDRGVIAPDTSTFVWCERGPASGADIRINQGQTQIYAFEGYEYALLSIGAQGFPGGRTLIDDTTWTERNVRSIAPRTLYHVFSTVELHLDCASALTVAPRKA